MQWRCKGEVKCHMEKTELARRQQERKEKKHKEEEGRCKSKRDFDSEYIIYMRRKFVT